MTFREIAAVALDEASWVDGDDFDESLIAEDAEVDGGQNTNTNAALEFDLQKHDKRFHHGHYDGKTECKYREKMAAAMSKAGMNPADVKGLGETAQQADAARGGGSGDGTTSPRQQPSEAEKKFLALKAKFEQDGQTEISQEEFVKARNEYLLAELGEGEVDCIKKLEEAAKTDGATGEKAEKAAERILNDPKSSNAQKEGAQAILDARKEWKVNGKTYVDVSGMSFWDGMKEAFKAGWEGKDIVTDWDKMSGRWDQIKASDPKFAEENGLLQDGVKDALADLGFGEDFEKAQKIEGLNREQWQEIGYLKYQYDQAEKAKDKHAAWRALKDYLKEQGLEKEKKGGKGGTMEPIKPTYKGPLAGEDLLDPETANTNDQKYGDDCAKELADRLDRLGVKTAGAGTAHVGPSATVIEFPVSADYKIGKAKAAMANLGAAIGAKITSVDYAPGKKDTLRIEFTNDKMRTVGFSNVIKSKEWDEKKDKYAIPTAIGKDSSGNDIVHDDSKMPHEVVTGETGSGKSVYLQSKINSAQMAKRPEEYQQVLIDPKRQEFGNQTGSPYNMYPVQFTPEGAAKVIASLRQQMDERASQLGVNLDEYDETKNEHIEGADANLQAYNAKQTDPSKKLPFVKIYIDELAALTKDPTYGPQIEADLDQLMAKSRSIGFSFTLSSQRNDVASIKGSIAANAPSRMIFKAAKDDAKASRAAKSLGGEGDFIHVDKNGKETRGRACYISDGEKKRIADFYLNGGKVGAAKPTAPTPSPAPTPAPASPAPASPAPSPTQTTGGATQHGGAAGSSGSSGAVRAAGSTSGDAGGTASGQQQGGVAAKQTPYKSPAQIDREKWSTPNDKLKVETKNLEKQVSSDALVSAMEAATKAADDYASKNSGITSGEKTNYFLTEYKKQLESAQKSSVQRAHQSNSNVHNMTINSGDVKVSKNNAANIEKLPDGTEIVTNGDRKVITHPDGRVEVYRGDGRSYVEHPDGSSTSTNGQRVVKTKHTTQGNAAAAQPAAPAAQTKTVPASANVTNLSQSQVKRAEALTQAQEAGVKAFQAAQPAKNAAQKAKLDGLLGGDGGFAEDS